MKLYWMILVGLVTVITPSALRGQYAPKIIEVHMASAAGGYAAGDYVDFGSISDFYNNTNGVVVLNANDSWLRDSVGATTGVFGTSPSDYWAFNSETGELVNGGTSLGTAAWAEPLHFSVIQGPSGALAIDVVIDTGLGWGNLYEYSSVSDFLSNTNSVLKSTGWRTLANRSIPDGYGSGDPNGWVLESHGLWGPTPYTDSLVNGVIGSLGVIPWLGWGSVDQFSVDQNSIVPLPEPGSAALLVAPLLFFALARRRAGELRTNRHEI